MFIQLKPDIKELSEAVNVERVRENLIDRQTIPPYIAVLMLLLNVKG